MGTLYLIGAGPGDPGLLTVRGVEVLAGADVVIHDASVNPQILACAPPAAELICIANAGGEPPWTQQSLREVLVAAAARHGSVVYLDAGDAFSSGPGAEHARALRNHGIPLEIVPGVSIHQRRPLAGRTIVVTRARKQAGEFVAFLRTLGASVIEFPTIRITEARDPQALRSAAAAVADYDWLLFTSVNGVEHFWSALRQTGGDARSLGPVRVCAIGPATGAALARRGIHPDLIPAKFVAEEVVTSLAAASDLRGKRILLPRAEIARQVLPEGLEARGAVVNEVPAYRTQPDGAGADEVRTKLGAGEIDLVTFTASSTVRNYVELVGSDVAGAAVASIGPITSRTARGLGLPVHVEAAEYTIAGLGDAILNYYAQQ